MNRQIAGWCDGPGQRAATRRYSALQDWALHTYGVLPIDLADFVKANFPNLIPALSGLPCAGYP